MEQAEDKKSKYNSALNIIFRINNLWEDTHRHARQINYAQWNEDLDRIWMELVTDAKTGEGEEVDKITALNNEIRKSGVYGGLSKLKRTNPVLFSKTILQQKTLLLKKEALLREIQNRQGKGIIYEDDIQEYMD